MAICLDHALVATSALILAAASVHAETDQEPPPPPTAAAPQPEPGLWEILVRIDVPEGPIKDASQAMRHCYTREELADLRTTIPRADPDCSVRDFRLEGDRATWTLSCPGSSVVSGGGEMILGRHAYAANIWNEITEGDRVLRVTQRIRARRLGDCMAGEPESGSREDSGAQSPPASPPLR